MEHVDSYIYEIKNYFINSYSKKLAKNMIPLYEMLPNKNYFEYLNTSYIDNCIYQDQNNDNLTKFKVTQKFIKTLDWVNTKHLKTADDFWDNVDLIKTLNTVNSYIISGDGIPTISKIKMKDPGSDECEFVEYANGDGEVTIESANIGNKINPDRTFYINLSHKHFMHNDSVICQIINILNNKSALLAPNIHNHPSTTIVSDYNRTSY